jgi:hypothetical protein
MAEAVKMKAPAHYLRVDLDDPGEAEYWLVVLDASRRQLEAAVASVGRDALEVRRWLEGRFPLSLRERGRGEGPGAGVSE